MSTRSLGASASSLVLAFACALAIACAACGGAQPEASTSGAPAGVSTSVATTAASAGEPPRGAQSSPAIAELWRARCGQCHVRVEPGTRDRAVLGPALERHKKRARLSESDVAALVDFLAK